MSEDNIGNKTVRKYAIIKILADKETIFNQAKKMELDREKLRNAITSTAKI